ncbi:hypothetical protein SHKM778_35810 [Streptomyces sp. KM77-8]|uniref:Uncharacterized protein n=1 Tax=Streptomyces haneummycinicus TaxID=3074435 RepID=A0AAT9HI65_9ACTN
MPRGVPLPQETPRASVRSAGRKTRYWSPSRYRKGFSRESGVRSSVVYGGSGKPCAGAPSTPENTMFQTALVQSPTELSRVYHCCCE